MVLQNLAIELPKILEEKIAEKKVKAETKVLKAKYQARYFFSKLRELHQLEESRKMKNRIRGFKKKLAPSRDEDDDTVGTGKSEQDGHQRRRANKIDQPESPNVKDATGDTKPLEMIKIKNSAVICRSEQVEPPKTRNRIPSFSRRSSSSRLDDDCSS